MELYQLNELSLSRHTTPKAFHKIMQNCLDELNYTSCSIYMDDAVLLVQSGQVVPLRQVIEKLVEHGYMSKTDRCYIFKRNIEYYFISVPTFIPLKMKKFINDKAQQLSQLLQ